MHEDTSHLQAEMITFALMILSGSFKLETGKKVNENELRYNPQTLQTSSPRGHRYITFKESLCEEEKSLQWQTYYLLLSKVKASMSLELDTRLFLSIIAWVLWYLSVYMNRIIMNDEGSFSNIQKTWYRSELSPFHQNAPTGSCFGG